MGVCLSCLGLRKDSGDQADRTRLLYDDYPSSHGYGTWATSNIPSQNVMSQEEVQREQEALDNITRWASDQIVEIFPHQHRNLAMSAVSSQFNGNGTAEPSTTTTTNTTTTDDANPTTVSTQSHQDILLSVIPGDKSKRSIRIYPASRPTSKDAQSLRSKTSFAGGLSANGTTRSTGSTKDAPVLVTLDVNI
ncbi:hypothetical protein HRR83_004984 [Exophiala dermatitidis]|uniref:Uncharacterized protein n=2 Tax=Exophiala dermatitidis TaxID=5970 RepID=H6C3E4_EXODN|nr:uncharacterized protein HMPREF1120_06173 [Exophiala dermatitidis NIH/UT8656]KAJ4513858.1 hypothetical protein HRR75_004439 [Exophiala dermatitidis]EHY58159.1 hypothetical protein HMPREF1120_06173 [Exophiala dermatitidis NIH/UT8656]KAJ4517103.1 hypothetical protein HRR74_004853 [Exophiala dermatitidis]KAJ4519720.1 hypothetical protein HRR73_003780 [Exophiala dermatitidis]KAJ4534477.1 hypothetical protein HRR76_006403 [Exophiala dermatitidis]